MKIISQGAEAVLLQEKDAIVKERRPKQYRLPELDDVLRKQRTRREAKVMETLTLLKIPCPRLLAIDDKGRCVTMENIKGSTLSDVLESAPYMQLFTTIGKYVGLMHANHIIHGDLTTSNIMLTPEKEIVFVDFGLSFFSTKREDKAVDLHLLQQALASKHYTIADACWSAFCKGYSSSPDHKAILQRLAHVQQRGRNKAKH
ncbi:Kae1-associated serine/threonine protein kinase [Candidatus Woesearchaeota archaeon]|nr:Kae1-associated serine/threonine protein kinase [Candidatus Woesearchaeota archaeon]